MFLIRLAGGLGLFLFGIQLTGDGLKRVAGCRLKQALESLTQNRFTAVLLGAMVAGLLQSCSATMVMLVGLVNASVLQLGQTIGVILGAEVGATLTVQLITLRISEYAPLLIGVGFLARTAGRRKGVTAVGQMLLGFGLIFFGVGMLSGTIQPLQSSPLFREILVILGRRPIFGVLAAAALTAIIQSSTATISLIILLAARGIILLPSAVPLVLGANLGSCFATLLACAGSPRSGKRVAIIHIAVKAIGVTACLTLLPLFGRIVGMTASTVPGQIANAHTLFNLGLVLLFIPFSDPLARLASVLLPDTADNGGRGTMYLDWRLLDTPPLALAHATKETLRMADAVHQMVDRVMEMFSDDSERTLEEVMKSEEETDRRSCSISRYLVDLSERSLGPDESESEYRLMHIVNDLEHIGDVLESVSRLAVKKAATNVEFSEEGRAELADMHERVLRQLHMALAAFTTGNRRLAGEALSAWDEIQQLERILRTSHMRRLHDGLEISVNSSMIHLDLINYFRNIAWHASAIAQAVLGDFDEDPGRPAYVKNAFPIRRQLQAE